MLKCLKTEIWVQDGRDSRQLFRLDEVMCSPGQMTLCYGPSGSGKTSFLEMCAGLIQPKAGTVFWDDKQISTFTDYGAQMCFMTAAPCLFNELTIRDNIFLPLDLKKQNTAKAHEHLRQLMKLLDLTHLSFSETPQYCSSGEKIRISLCRTLIQCPKIVILDEPTANCDAALSKVIFSFLAQHAIDSNVAVIVASHDSLAHEYAHQHIDLAKHRN